MQKNDDLIYVEIANHIIELNYKNKHESQYIDLIRSGKKNIDRLVAEHFLRPGDVVLDAGANIGFLTLQYLELGASTVHAVEPVSNVFRRLQSICDSRVHLHHVALAESGGVTTIYLSKTHDQGHTLNPDFIDLFPGVFDLVPKTESVISCKADELFSSVKFDFMKIDIEGSEESFILGAHKLLAYKPPRAIQIEIYPSEFYKVDKLLTRYFSIGMRVGKKTDVDEICFFEPSHSLTGDFCLNPPTFIYANEMNLFSEKYIRPGGQ